MAWVTFFGLKGIEKILKSSIKKNFLKNISKNKFDIYSGPLLVSFFQIAWAKRSDTGLKLK